VPTKRVTGGALPAQIWSGFMQAALKGKRPTPLPRAEPLYEPLIAEAEDGEHYGFFDRLERFFDRIIGDPRRTRRPEAVRPQVRGPEPRFGADREYARDRYAYQPQNAYPEPRRGYGYAGEQRNRPRYGYGGYEQERRRDREPGYFNRQYERY
jgi:penicillin-binding protein 1A